MNISKIKTLIPFVILFILFAILWRELFYSKPNELPSALIGETIPDFQLPNIYQPTNLFTQKNLVGHVSLLNVWATWCYACSIEHKMLMKIKEQYHIPIYSINYKDDPLAAKGWLQKFGNPYVMTGSDLHGDVAIDLGVYGTPETFVISKEGKIVYRHIGIIDQKVWDDVLYPIVKKYEDETTSYPFTSSADTKRFESLTSEIRCVVCQNQNIADSNAPLANDLRKKVYDMVLDKKSNNEIKDYLVKRYGEFILLQPRFNTTTLILWAFPFIGLITVFFFLCRHVKSKT